MGGINKRAALIRAGQELIWSKGYDLCSIKDITTAAKLPKGSFYHYFESKEKFALEAMNNYIDSFVEKWPDEEASLETLERMLDRRIASVKKIDFARECYMSVMCHAYTKQEETFRLAVLEAIEKSNESMERLLHALKEKDLLRPGLEVAEVLDFIDFSWRGARLKARLSKSVSPLLIFKKHLFQLIGN